MGFIFGTSGNDKLHDHSDSGDSYQGMAGDDTLVAGRGDDTLAGGSDFDRADYSQHQDAAGWTFNLATMIATRSDNGVIVETDTFANIEAVRGTASADTFIGDTNRNVFHGGDGDDTFNLSGGSDEYFGEGGLFDTLAGDFGLAVVNFGDAKSYDAGFGAGQISYAAGSIRLSDGTVQLISGVEQINNHASDAAMFFGSLDDNTFNLGSGDDTVFAAGGDDTLRGGFLSFDDTVNYSLKIDGTRNYGPGGSGMNILLRDEVLTGSDNEVAMRGYAQDRVNGLLERDELFSINHVIATFGDDYIKGGRWSELGIGDGGSTILGLGGNDTIVDAEAGWGGSGDDLFLQSLYANDQVNPVPNDNGMFGGTLRGETGNDTFVLSTGADVIIEVFGGGDNDTVRFFQANVPGIAPTTAFVIDLQAGEVLRGGTGLFATLDSIENATGGARGDQIFGDGLANQLDGFDGDDLIYGSGGDDTIRGGAGNDSLYGDSDHDTLDGGTGDDRMDGGLGDDVYYVDSLNDIVIESNNQGNDTIRTTLTNLNLSDFANIENIELVDPNDGSPTGGGPFFITGSSANNHLIGTDEDDKFIGGGGNDTLTGNGGNDTLNGGTGADLMLGGGGNDLLFVNSISDDAIGGTGVDRVLSSVSFTLGANTENLTLTGGGNTNGIGNGGKNVIVGNRGNNLIDGKGGNDLLFGSAGRDTLRGDDGRDMLNGGNHADRLIGGHGMDTLMGQAGNDVLLGGEVADRLLGGSGRDRLLGGDGGDTLIGGVGSDTLMGQAGNDHLVGGTANDLLLGGFGLDISGFSGARARYDVTRIGVNKYKVVDMIGNLGADTLVSVEKIAFTAGGTFDIADLL